MGSSSAIRSLGALLLAGCYAQADLELTVVRPDDDAHLTVRVCDPSSLDCSAAPLSVFDPVADDGRVERLVSIFVDDGSSAILVDLEASHPVAFRTCYQVELGDGTVARRVELGASPPWTCPDGGACEAPQATCPP